MLRILLHYYPSFLPISTRSRLDIYIPSFGTRMYIYLEYRSSLIRGLNIRSPIIRDGDILSQYLEDNFEIIRLRSECIRYEGFVFKYGV